MDPATAASILEEERRFQARKVAEARYAFRWHLPVYVFVNAGLVAVWYFATPREFPWPIFPIIFWGLGLAAHYVSAYRSPGQIWISRETEKLLQRQQYPRATEKTPQQPEPPGATRKMK